MRGFRYQSVGPHSRTAIRPAAPRSAPGSVEFRQRILGNYGVVGFVDAGPGDRERRAVHQQLAGGRRRRRPLLHLDRPNSSDVAIPLNQQPRGDALELYIGHRAGVLNAPRGEMARPGFSQSSSGFPWRWWCWSSSGQTSNPGATCWSNWCPASPADRWPSPVSAADFLTRSGSRRSSCATRRALPHPARRAAGLVAIAARRARARYRAIDRGER